jgi:transposase
LIWSAKRFIVTDTLGLLLTVVVVTAAVQDRDGAKPALLQAYLCTRVRFVFTDGAFAGRLLDWAYTILRTTLHIVRKPADQRGFVVIPRRWAVERTFAWLTAHRRLARDYERDPAISKALIRWAAINTIPQDRPRRARHPAATTHLHHRKLIFSNTLSVRNARTTCGRRSRTD